MLRSLHTKLVMIMVLLILSLMTVVGAFLVNSVTAFYLEEFYTQMADVFDDQGLYSDLSTPTEAETAGEADGAQMLESILNVYAGELGVDGRNRKLYILDSNGACLIHPDGETGQLNYSSNLTYALTEGLETMEAGDESSVAGDFMDVAIPIRRGEDTYIIYILDNKTTANSLTGRGLSPCLLCWPERAALYGRLGFAPKGTLGRYISTGKETETSPYAGTLF